MPEMLSHGLGNPDEQSIPDTTDPKTKSRPKMNGPLCRSRPGIGLADENATAQQPQAKSGGGCQRDPHDLCNQAILFAPKPAVLIGGAGAKYR
jgi:hypothetical protein